jgi:dTMP kinase
MSRGLFITFEGPEGSGKSTQARRLAERLKAAGREVVATREPGGTRTGEAIRNIVQHDSAGEPIYRETEVLLFAASRAQLVRAVILPALERGACVVSDRFSDSTTAYQGYGRGLDVETIRRINALAIGPAVPDLTFLLDLDIRAGFERLRARGLNGAAAHDRIEREDAEFHERVRRGYLELAAGEGGRWRVIGTDREQDLVHGDIWSATQILLQQRGGKR